MSMFLSHSVGVCTNGGGASEIWMCVAFLVSYIKTSLNPKFQLKISIFQLFPDENVKLTSEAQKSQKTPKIPKILHIIL